MNKYLVYAVMFFTVHANAENPIANLVRGLLQVQTGRVTLETLVSNTKDLKVFPVVMQDKKWTWVNYYFQIAGTTKRADSSILVSMANGKDIEVLVGGSDLKLLNSYKERLKKKYARKSDVDDMMRKNADVGIAEEAIQVGEKALVIGERIARKYGLTEKSQRDFFSTYWDTIKNKFDSELGGERFTHVVFKINGNADAKAVQDLLNDLADIPL